MTNSWSFEFCLPEIVVESAAAVKRTDKSRKPQSPPVSLVRPPTANRLLETVRELAQQQQLDQPQVFLSLRQAARQFKVRVSEMKTVYARLSEERLLNTIRSSRTMLTGRKIAHDLHVQGVIALPVSTPRLVKLHDYRECYLHIHDELEARGFVVKRFLFETVEIEPATVAARAKKEKVDIVLWLFADDRIREAALRMRDQGVQFVALNTGPLGEAFIATKSDSGRPCAKSSRAGRPRRRSRQSRSFGSHGKRRPRRHVSSAFASSSTQPVSAAESKPQATGTSAHV